MFVLPFFVFLLFLYELVLSVALSLSVPVPSPFAYLRPSVYCLLVPQLFGMLSVLVLPSDILFLPLLPSSSFLSLLFVV